MPSIINYAFIVCVTFSLVAFHLMSWGGDYQNQKARLNTLQSQIQEADEQFAALSRHKGSLRDDQEISRVVQQMADIYRQREDLVGRHNAILRELRFRHPDKGQEVDHSYRPMNDGAWESVESGSELEELLSQARMQMRKAYGEDPEAAELESQRGPASEPVDPASQRLRIER